MSFVLPSGYWKEEASPPKPLDDKVTIARKGGGALDASDTLATLWFGGFAGTDEVARRKQELLEAVRADRDWEPATDELLLMQYNDPFVRLARGFKLGPSGCAPALYPVAW